MLHMTYINLVGQGVLNLLLKKSGLTLFIATVVFCLLAATPASARQTTGGGAKKSAAAGAQSSGKKAENRFKLTLSLDFQNLFNRANFTAPVGNLSSPFFGQSTRILGSSGFEGGGSATPAFNRRVEMQVRLSF